MAGVRRAKTFCTVDPPLTCPLTKRTRSPQLSPELLFLPRAWLEREAQAQSGGWFSSGRSPFSVLCDPKAALPLGVGRVLGCYMYKKRG